MPMLVFRVAFFAVFFAAFFFAGFAFFAMSSPRMKCDGRGITPEHAAERRETA